VRAHSSFYTSVEVNASDPIRLSERIIYELADYVYILCVRCDSSGLPLGSTGKTTFVHAHVLDDCLHISHSTHYVKASIAHAHILETASKHTTHAAIAVLEEDTFSEFDYSGYVGSLPTAELLESLRGANWRILRLGYKPFFLIDNTVFTNILPFLPKSCGPECTCSKFHEQACMMYGRGCDMRSSDAYIIRRNALSDLRKAIETGNVIDVHAMQAISPQAFLVPQLNFQSGQSIQASRQLAETFKDICVS